MNRTRSVCVLAAGLLFFLAAARGQSPFAGPDEVRSVSGQFVVSSTPPSSPFFYHRPSVAAKADFLQLEPSVLAISAERFKSALWRFIGLPADSTWSGKIFLALHPARSTNEPVVIATEPFLQNWNYRLELPDIITRTRYARAFSAVLLMELANRNVPVNARPAGIPPWLADGLARQVVAADATQVIFSAPTRLVDGLAETRVNLNQRGIDPLAASRRILQNAPALTFEQLSWPDDRQENGADGGVYLASTQLLVNELLALKNGPQKLRNLIAQLPRRENWQTAFFSAFRDDFRSPLDVEKWWSLQVVAFAAHDPGPLWTIEVSRLKLDAVLSVPVDLRSASNDLPSHVSISLQAAVRNFEPPLQTQILETKLRDLNLVQFRLAAPLAPLGDGYRTVLAEYLGAQKRHSSARRRRGDAEKLIRQLNVLDQRRQELETRLAREALPVPTR